VAQSSYRSIIHRIELTQSRELAYNDCKFADARSHQFISQNGTAASHFNPSPPAPLPEAGRGEHGRRRPLDSFLQLLLPAFLFACVLLAQRAQLIAADDVATARAALDAKYLALTEKLVDRLASEGNAEGARIVRTWIMPRVPGRRSLFLPPADAAAKPKFAGADEWLKLRKFYAQRLFEIAKQALDENQLSLAYGLVYEVLREDPDHALARSIVDFERDGDVGPWRTRFAKRQFAKGGLVEHEKFGWLPKEHVKRYDAGQRPLDGRWVSVAEEDRIKGAKIDRGWRVETEHYEITTNHSLEAGVECGRRLEELHTAWRQLFTEYWFTSAELKRRFAGQPSTMTVPRHKVLLFRNREQYVAHLERDEPAIKQSLGYYAEKPRTAYFYAGDEDTLATWFHEATHQLFHERQKKGMRPAGMDDNFWVVEGIATYMESLRKGDGYCTVGGPGAYRLQFARYRALTEGYDVPLAKLVTLGRDEVKGMGADLPKLYSLAAGLSQFFMDADNGKHRDAFVKYLDDVYRDKATATTLATLLGEPYQKIDEQYGEFLRATDDDLAALLPGEYVPRLYLGRTRITDRALEHIAKVDGLERLDVGFCPITDAGLQQLPARETLVQLNAERTKITDASLAHIAQMNGLRELDLSGCQITDASLARIAELKQLETLWLTDTPITDAGLHKLHGLANLKFVDVGGSRVTAAGFAELKRAVPSIDSNP
jgi:hypothetical protein